MTVFIETFGCKVNCYESAALLRLFGEAGFSPAADAATADAVVVNSCTVTENADRKARLFVNKVRRENPRAALLLCGCFPQAFPEQAAALGADVLMGTGSRKQAPAALLRFLETGQRQNLVGALKGASFEPLESDELLEHTRAFLKIEEGCERYCSYCAIPKARGPVRSMPLEEVARQAARFAENGYRELVLAGINLSAYGNDLGCDLGDAVLAAAAPAGVLRVRLGSLECDILTDAILEKFASCPKFCPQFHLSLQSGCDRTLARMNRRYTAEEYAAVCARIRARFERPTFTTDIITGFPGETEADFEESLRFCEAQGFLRAHVFPYSRRAGTMAAALPEQLPRAEKERRAKRMSEAMKRAAEPVFAAFVGQRARVILEQRSADGSFSGYTDRYLPARVTGEGLCARAVAEGRIARIEGGCAVVEADRVAP